MPNGLQFTFSLIAALCTVFTLVKNYKKYKIDVLRGEFELLLKIREELETRKPNQILLEFAFSALFKGHAVSLEEVKCIMRINNSVKALKYFSSGARHLTYCRSKEKFFINAKNNDKAIYSSLIVIFTAIWLAFSFLLADETGFALSFIAFSALFSGAYYFLDEVLAIRDAEKFLDIQNNRHCGYILKCCSSI